MNNAIIHGLAIAAGVLGIVASSAPQLGIPASVASGIGVVIAVLVYISNNLPAMGASESAPAKPVAPVQEAPAPTPAAVPAQPQA